MRPVRVSNLGLHSGLRAKSKPGLPCQDAYSNGTFAPGPDLEARLKRRDFTKRDWLLNDPTNLSKTSWCPV